MLTRRLGKSNIKVSGLGMGCWAIGGPFKGKNGQYLAYGNVNDNESIQTIHKALELGVNFFDTAEVYGINGRSEEVLGEALKDKRENVVIATKFSTVHDDTKETTPNIKTIREKLYNAVNGSLKRLKTNYIDIYQLHNAVQQPKSALVIREVLEELVDDGKILYYGWSTDDANRAKEFAGGKHCTAMQYVLNLTRSNTPMSELCKNADMAVIIRQPLQSGILTGKYTPNTKRTANHMLGSYDFTQERYLKIFKALNQLKELIKDDKSSLTQIALRYIWSKDQRSIPIPGAKTVKQIELNTDALNFGPLSNQLTKEIDLIFRDIRQDISYETFTYYKK